MQRRILLGWSVGSFTSAALVGAVSLLHLRYMTDSLGLAIGVAGLLVVVSKVYDAVLDPLMGIAADRTTTPWGRHRPYLLGGSLLAAVSLVMLFNVPHALAGKWLVGYCGVSLLVFSTAYTMFRIPYLALGRRLTQNFHERSQLMTYSVYGSSFGGMAATSAAPLLLAKLGSDRAAHGLLAWLLAGLVALGGAATFALLRASEAEHGGTDDAREHFSAAATWRALVGNRPFAGLIGFKMVMFSGLTLHGAALPFYTRHALHSTDISISSIFLAQTITMMLSQPAWVRIARRLGRRRALVLAAMLEALAMLCWFLVPAAAPSPWVQIIGGFEGICIGGLFFGLYTMLTDTMDHAQAAPGASSQEAMLAGVFVMVEKATAAFGTFLFSLMMAWAGFVSGHDTGAVQPAGVVLGIMLSMSLIPALAALAACLFLRPPPKPMRQPPLFNRSPRLLWSRGCWRCWCPPDWGLRLPLRGLPNQRQPLRSGPASPSPASPAARMANPMPNLWFCPVAIHRRSSAGCGPPMSKSARCRLALLSTGTALPHRACWWCSRARWKWALGMAAAIYCALVIWRSPPI